MRVINTNAQTLTRAAIKRAVGYLLPLNGNFAIPHPRRHILLINNNIKMTPLLFLTRDTRRMRTRAAFLVNTGQRRSLLRRSHLTVCNALYIAARSKSRKIPKFIARRPILRGRAFSEVCIYNPQPVVATITHLTGREGIPYRISLRGLVTYNLNTYLYYARRAIRNGLHIYSSKPIFSTTALCL